MPSLDTASLTATPATSSGAISGAIFEAIPGAAHFPQLANQYRR